jgi:NADH-quinone oxidoreductase subunit M
MTENFLPFPLLSSMIILPLLGAIAVFLVKKEQSANIALTIVLFELLLALIAVNAFDHTSATFQLVERYAWIPSLHVEILLGIDGIAILFLPASTLLMALAMLASKKSIHELVPLYYSLLLVLEGVTIGIFTALDTMLFFMFWELTLPPLFFLLSLWGVGPYRRTAAVKYTLFMVTGGIALLMAFVILALYSTRTGQTGAIASGLLFSYPELLESGLRDEWQNTVFLLLMLGFAVKTPLFPFHTWMPTTAMEGPPQVTAWLTGLKLGAFGIIRFAMPLAPTAAVEYSWILGVLGAVTLIYGAFIACNQSNLRRLLAYASISHVGLVVVGITALNMQGIQGAVFQLLNFTVIAGALMLIAGMLQHRLGSTEMVHLGGMAKVAPRLTVFYFMFALASIGIPGTSGFPAELLLIFSALFAHLSLGIVALVAAILSAGYMLDSTRKAFWGPIVNSPIEHMHDLRPREVLLLTIPMALVLFIGFIPNAILKFNQKSAEAWLTHIMEQPLIKHDDLAEIEQAD